MTNKEILQLFCETFTFTVDPSFHFMVVEPFENDGTLNLSLLKIEIKEIPSEIKQ